MRSPTVARPLGIAVGALGVTAAATIVWFTCVNIVPQYDLMVFIRAGQDVLAGRSPYPPLDSEFVYSGHAFVYPYAAALPFVLLAVLPAGVTHVLFYVVSVGAVLLTVWLSGSRDPRTYVFALLAATTIRSMQVGSLNALLLLACFLAWRLRDRPLPGGGALAAAVVSKVFLAPVIGWLVLARRWRVAAAAVVITGGVLLLGWLLGPLGFGDYRTMLEILSRHETQQGFSLHGLLLGRGWSASAARIGTLAAAAILVAVAYWWYRRTQAEVVVFAASIGAALLVSPIVWNHYFVLLLAPLLAAKARWPALALFALTSWLIAPPVSLGAFGDFVGGLLPAQYRVPAVQLGILAVVIACAWLASRNTRDDEAAPGVPS